MIPFRTILAAADFSENSRQAFRLACALAREDKTRILVLHVAEPAYVAVESVYMGQHAVPFYPAPRDQAAWDSLKVRLREAYVPDRALDLEYQLAEGPAVEEILKKAGEHECDLIVLGTHGRAGLERLLAGSVAEGVLRKAHCPVLALRALESPRENTPIRVILHPTDFSDRSALALQFARCLAQFHGARLVVLHVAPPELLVNGTSAVAIDPLVYRIPLEEIRERVEGRDLKFPPEIHLGRGHAATEILRTANAVKGDLIVMGTHGRSGLGRLLMGSVAEEVLRGAVCPVLAVKGTPAERVPAPAHTAPATIIAH